MKRIIFTVLLVVAFMPALFAQGGRNVLRVSLSDNSRMDVALNGRYFEKHGTSLTIGDLPAGRHFLKVYTYQQDERGRGQAHLIYKGYIRLHRGTYAECVVDPNTGSIQLNEDGDAFKSSYSYNQRQSVDGPQRNDRSNNDDRRYDNDKPISDDVYDNGSARDNANDNAIGAFGTGPMSKGDMDGLKSMVRGRDNDADKVQFMQSQTKGKSFTTEQVSKMMGWLKADDSRLEFAEWAYPFVTDKENYKQLGSGFSNKDYLKQLDKFIQSRR